MTPLRSTSPTLSKSADVSTKPAETATPTTIISYEPTDWQAFTQNNSWLEQQVGKPMAVRIHQLLEQNYWACPTNKNYGDEFPNCFGTALWVTGIDTGPAPQMFGHPQDGQWDDYDNFSYAECTQNLITLVSSHGYALAETAQVLTVNPVTAAQRRARFEEESQALQTSRKMRACLTFPIPITSSFANLLPGDLLFFGNGNADSPDIVHAAVYLGTNSAGEHIIFEKESSGCGAISQFRLTTLEAYLQEASTTEDLAPIFDFSLMWVYRAKS